MLLLLRHQNHLRKEIRTYIIQDVKDVKPEDSSIRFSYFTPTTPGMNLKKA
jgi:hypothetical protein